AASRPTQPSPDASSGSPGLLALPRFPSPLPILFSEQDDRRIGAVSLFRLALLTALLGGVAVVKHEDENGVRLGDYGSPGLVQLLDWRLYPLPRLGMGGGVIVVVPPLDVREVREGRCAEFDLQLDQRFALLLPRPTRQDASDVWFKANL